MEIKLAGNAINKEIIERKIVFIPIKVSNEKEELHRIICGYSFTGCSSRALINAEQWLLQKVEFKDFLYWLSGDDVLYFPEPEDSLPEDWGDFII